MSSHLNIKYRDFSDVPRIFIVAMNDRIYLFDSPFDVTLDEYASSYEVYLLQEPVEKDLSGSWGILTRLATKGIGTIPVSAVEFDSTRRKTINCSVFDQLNITQ